MGIPDVIRKEHILRALRQIDESGVPERRRSRDYCLTYEGKHYPPKYVISKAAVYAIGREFESSEFLGGEGPGCANPFLRSRGFEVIDCGCGGVGFREEIPRKKPKYAERSLTRPKGRGECCANLFTEFEFQGLVSADPPSKKGVYVVRIKSKSESTPRMMVEKTRRLVSRLGWKLVEKHIIDRVERIGRIGHCPIIYIGSAGTRRESRNTLRGRYKEFSGRHTAMYPIWVLLYFGWKLEFGWKECDEPEREETMLKRAYSKAHQGNLPALVKL